jgi:hypothetical protein
VEAEDAGRMVICVACGRVFAAPATLQPDAPSPKAAPAGEQTVPWMAAPPPSAQRSALSAESSGGLWYARRTWILAAGACALALLLIGALIVVLTGSGKRQWPEVAETPPTVAPSQVVPPTTLPTAEKEPVLPSPGTPGVGPRLPSPGTPGEGRVVASAPRTEPLVVRNADPTTEPSPGLRPTSRGGGVPGEVKRPASQPVVEIPRWLKRREARATALPDKIISDEQIGKSIAAGAQFIQSQLYEGRLRRLSDHPDYYAGLDCLCVYALIQSAHATGDERLSERSKAMKEMLDKARLLPVKGRFETYTHGLRATLLAAANRPEDRATLKADVQWLLKASRNGAYTYGLPTPNNSWDNSNSQYGVLGVWGGAEVGMEVPDKYWRDVQAHWTGCQLPSGEWAYWRFVNEGRLSMTAAGIVSQLLAYDYLSPASFGEEVGRPPYSQSLANGLKWLEQEDNCTRIPLDQNRGYALFSLERVGLVSGFKYFGTHDWYPELAASLIKTQTPVVERKNSKATLPVDAAASASADDIAETAFCLLFLARGRHPILMNKLRFDGAWANRPRDVANLARFASRELERPLNWQVIPLERNWSDWLECPIAYLASHEAIRLDDKARENLKSFMEAGGMLFTQADGGSEAFNKSVMEFSGELLPEYQWQDLPADHPIYTVNYRIDPRPPLRYLTNGVRVLWLHSPQDLSKAWQVRAEQTQHNTFDLGLNLFIYAAGKTELRNRLSSPYIPAPQLTGVYSLPLARLKYSGAWDPEPYAFRRFARWFGWQTGYGLDVATVEVKDLTPDTAPVAHLTGTSAYAPSDEEVAALRKYVEAGGVLLIDACGGSAEFDGSVRAGLLDKAFPQTPLRAVEAGHALLSGGSSGMEGLPRPVLRTGVGQRKSQVEMLRAGHGAIIYSSLDMTAALLGTNTWGISGYRPDYARNLLKNIILWAADGAEK